MSWDLMSYLSRATSWLTGGDHRSANVDAGAQAGAGEVHGRSGAAGAYDLLGGMVGGFGAPMDWHGAGLGGQAHGRLQNSDGDYLSGNVGLGIGAAGSNWSTTTADGRHMNGVSGVSGGVAPLGLGFGTQNTNINASTNAYSGVGGSAYSYQQNTRGGGLDRGYGVAGTATPLGLADTNVALNTRLGSANVHADNAYMNRLQAGGTVGHNSDGTYHGDVNGGVTSGVEGVNTRVTTGLGTVGARADSVNFGTTGNLGGSYNSRTGAAEVHGGFQDGLDARNVGVGYNSPGGDVSYNASAGRVFYGTRGQGTAGYDPRTGTFTATGSGSGGGVVVTDTNIGASVNGIGNYQAHLGEFSNDTRVSGSLTADANHARLQGSADGMGMRFSDFNASGQLGNGPNAVRANAGFDSLGNNNSINDAYLQANWRGSDPSLQAGFRNLSFGEWSGSNLHANVDGPFGAHADARVGSFATGFAAEGFNATLNRNGLNAHLDNGQYSDFNVQNIDVHSRLGNNVYSDLHVGDAASDRIRLQNANVNASWDPRQGVHANVGSASYDEVGLSNIDAHQHLGPVLDTRLHLTEGSMNHASAENIRAGLDLTNGLTASLDHGNYSFLQGRDLNVAASLGDGAVGARVRAGDASLGGVSAGHMEASSTLQNTHAAVSDLNAHGWVSNNQQVDANVGALGLGVGANHVGLADLHVGNANLDTSNFGLTGRAGVSGVNYDAINIQGAHAGLDWNGHQLAGVSGNARYGSGVDAANANWDLTHGTANASFQNANVGGAITNAHLNLLGHDLALPNMNARLNASGGANVDLSQGAANANLSLAGSNINIGGHGVTLPQWAQASAGVNASQGAANFNLGGANGIGANMNVANGQLSVDAFGHHLDVAQAGRDAVNSVSNFASGAASTASNLASSAWHALPHISLPHLW